MKGKITMATIGVATAMLTATPGVAQGPASAAKPGHLRMALVAMKSVYSNLADETARQAALEANIQRHLYFIDKALEQGAEFVGFPEISLNGYNFRDNVAWLRLDGPEVAVFKRKAIEKRIHIGVGLAEEDAAGKRWNTQIVIGPDGAIIGRQNKMWLTAESGHVERGTQHNVFDVKGIRMGMVICADGTDYQNLKALADKGAQLIYAPHANTTGGTIAGWYRFRARWGGQWDGEYAEYATNNNGPVARAPKGGWCHQLGVHAALVNHAGLFNPDFDPPVAGDGNTGWASGAWFIGPDGGTLAQMPPSGNKADSKEFMLIHDMPLPAR